MSIVERALKFAKQAHEGQKRKNSNTPYIMHPIAVAKILEESGLSQEVIAAGLLHDTVEDTPATIEDIADHFGEIVSNIVAAHTEDKTKSWEERKQHTIDVSKSGPIEVKALIAADKLDNLRSLVESYAVKKDKVWDTFKRGYEKQKWYHLSVANNIFIGLDEKDIPAFFYQFKNEAEQFFNK